MSGKDRPDTKLRRAGAPIVPTRPVRTCPGRPDVYYQATADATGTYSLLLPVSAANESYTVRVQPTDSSTFPPLTSSARITGDDTLDFAPPRTA